MTGIQRINFGNLLNDRLNTIKTSQEPVQPIAVQETITEEQKQ